MLASLRRELHKLTSDSKFSEIFTGSVWVLSARILATTLGLGVSVIVARIYGTEVVGIIAVINSFLVLATIFTVLGTNTSILRLIPEHMVKYSPTSAFRLYRKTQFLVIGISAFTGIVLFFGAHFVANTVFSKPHMSYYFALTAVFVVFNAQMRLNTQAVRGLRLIKVFAFMQILPSLSNLILLSAITLFFFDMDNPIYAQFMSLAVTGIAGWIIMELAFKRKMNPEDRVQEIPSSTILSTSLPMLMTNTMGFALAQTGVIMLGIFRSDAEVGQYSIAVKLATLTSFIYLAINSMVAPKFSNLFHSGKIIDLFYVAKKSSKFVFWTTAPILIVLVLFGKFVLGIVYGSGFVVAYPAMVILILGQFVNSSSGATAIFMNMVGHEKVFSNIMVIAVIVNVAICLSTIPTIGMVGAAVATMISVSFLNIATLVYIKKRHGYMIGYFPLCRSMSNR